MISVIITAWRESKTVFELIKNIEDQASKIRDKIEILLTCPDKETKDAGVKADRLGIVDWVQDKGEGKPQALNKAIARATGEILVLTDGDVSIGKGAIVELLKDFRDIEVGAVTGRPIPLNPKTNMFGFWSHLLTEVGAHQQRLKKQKEKGFMDASGYLMAVRKDLVELIPSNALADDAVISRMVWANGQRIVYCPEAKVYVKYPSNFRDWLAQKKRSAGGYTQINDLARLNKGNRSIRFWEEISGISGVFSYPDNFREHFWMITLVAARVYLWVLIFWERRVIKKSFERTWVRIESTK